MRRFLSDAPADVIPFGLRHGAEAQDGARRADDAIEARAANLIEVLADLRVDVAVQFALVPRRERDRF